MIRPPSSRRTLLREAGVLGLAAAMAGPIMTPYPTQEASAGTGPGLSVEFEALRRERAALHEEYARAEAAVWIAALGSEYEAAEAAALIVLEAI